MYSYGSGSRAIGITSRTGHGGGNYRPPSNKRRKAKKGQAATPPALKECHCVVEWFVDEYSRPAVATASVISASDETPAVRQHSFFGGRNSMTSIQKALRQNYGVHLVVPGRAQAGPIMIAGRSLQDVIPAANLLLQQVEIPLFVEDTLTLTGENETSYIQGRVRRRDNDPRHNAIEIPIEGRFSVRKEASKKRM
jgi:hypothetical protein